MHNNRNTLSADTVLVVLAPNWYGLDGPTVTLICLSSSFKTSCHFSLIPSRQLSTQNRNDNGSICVFIPVISFLRQCIRGGLMAISCQKFRSRGLRWTFSQSPDIDVKEKVSLSWRIYLSSPSCVGKPLVKMPVSASGAQSFLGRDPWTW